MIESTCDILSTACFFFILNLVVDTGGEDGAAVSTPDNTSEEQSTEEIQGEREATSHSKTMGMNEWSVERWDTVTYVCS